MTKAANTFTPSRRGMLAGATAPLPGMYRPLLTCPDCPFCPSLGNVPLIRLPDRRATMKHAPSSAMLTGEGGANLVLPWLQGWAQAWMPGIAYDLRGANPVHGANHG